MLNEFYKRKKIEILNEDNIQNSDDKKILLLQ